LPLYQFFEMNHAAMAPARAMSDMTKLALSNPLNPMTHTPAGKSIAAACELFERATRRYGKPTFDIDEVTVEGRAVPVSEEIVWRKPFCELRHFQRTFPEDQQPKSSKVLIVAPMSGHYATLLRGTLQTMLERHDVYITDWVDARMVPVGQGTFDLDDYVDYLIELFQMFKGDVHVMAVCQPSVPVMAAVSVMEAANDPHTPNSMTLMGGPLDTRVNPTEVNTMAEQHSISWFRSNVIMQVPWPHPGMMRAVYPGFLQLTGFMTMNLNRHMDAHKELFRHLIEGDGDSADKHREFYDEYMAVMDLDAAFYLQTVDTVFIRHTLPKGEMTHRGELVDPSKIKRTALMTVEGEKDDISGVGQTEAAHKMCSSLPESHRVHYLQKGVGHYGVFNGSRFRSEIAPRISDFMASHERNDNVIKRAVRAVKKPSKSKSKKTT
jgi:poly(3-hydroxybutyrate) depolymerase